MEETEKLTQEQRDAERDSEQALENFKDWYLDRLEQDEWKMPVAKAVQILASDEDMKDFTATIEHYYMIHCINTWEDLQSEINNYELGPVAYNLLLKQYIIETSKTQVEDDPRLINITLNDFQHSYILDVISDPIQERILHVYREYQGHPHPEERVELQNLAELAKLFKIEPFAYDQQWLQDIL